MENTFIEILTVSSRGYMIEQGAEQLLSAGRELGRLFGDNDVAELRCCYEGG